MLDVFLALDCRNSRGVLLVIDQRFDAMFLREAVGKSFAMFVNATDKIAGYAHL